MPINNYFPKLTTYFNAVKLSGVNLWENTLICNENILSQGVLSHLCDAYVQVMDDKS